MFYKCADVNSGLHFVQRELAQVIINLLNANIWIDGVPQWPRVKWRDCRYCRAFITI
jgi:hypothetical protein